MSAAVCGSKRSFFEEIPSPQSASVSKKLRRCSPSSPSSICFSTPSPLDQLRAVFPHMDSQLLEKALLENGNDLDSAIKSLQELCLAAERKSVSPEEFGASTEQGNLTNDVDGNAAAVPQNPAAVDNFPIDGAEWVDLFVREMMSSTSVDDAKSRASRLLEILEKAISKRAGDDAAQNFQKENVMLKEQIDALVRENSILKRAVAIQHERQKECDEKNQELQHLKQLVSQYQEQLRTLEVNNYSLTMHLRQAQQSSSIPGRFHPDVF
ncbi:hypothetical protein SLA2020_467720 [Shorea laevis]